MPGARGEVAASQAGPTRQARIIPQLGDAERGRHSYDHESMICQDNVMAGKACAVGTPAPKSDPGAYLHQLAASYTAPLLLVDADLSILWANGAGHELLGRDGDVTQQDGRLRLNDADITATLHQFLIALQHEVRAWLYRTSVDHHVIRAQRLAPRERDPAFALTFYSNNQSQRHVWPDLTAAGLTHAEFKVLKGLAGGRTAGDLAGDLGISNATVRTHIRRIYAKLDVSSREELFAFVLHMRVL